jgi:hypothetical protein
MDEIIDMGNSDLEDLADKLKKRTNEKISISAEVLFGPPEQQIEFMSARKRPLAIVMGIKPGKTFERAALGSTVFHAMNHIPYPLLISPDNFKFSPVREIGLACDLEDMEEHMPIETIKEWLSLFNARLHIVHVSVKNKEFRTSQLNESVSLQNRFASFTPIFHFLEGSNLEDELNRFAKSINLDLLIVMPRTYGMFKPFHKKHSKKLIRHNQIPVLSVHELPARK